MPTKSKKAKTAAKKAKTKSRNLPANTPESIIEFTKKSAQANGLTDEELSFALCYLQTYSARQALVMMMGDKPLPDNLMRARAQQLITNDAVRAFINNYLKSVGESIGVDKQFLIHGILQDREMAREKGDVSAALKADELLGKLIGALVEKREVSIRPISEMTLEEVNFLLDNAEIVEGKFSEHLQIPRPSLPEKPTLAKRKSKAKAADETEDND